MLLLLAHQVVPHGHSRHSYPLEWKTQLPHAHEITEILKAIFNQNHSPDHLMDYWSGTAGYSSAFEIVMDGVATLSESFCVQGDSVLSGNFLLLDLEPAHLLACFISISRAPPEGAFIS